MLLTEDTEKERLAKLAALEEGEMLLDSPMPGSSTPACPHSSLPHQQGRPAWPQKSPALSSGDCSIKRFGLTHSSRYSKRHTGPRNHLLSQVPLHPALSSFGHQI